LESRAVAVDGGATPHLYGLHINQVMLRATLLDDWGPEPLLAEQQRDLLEIVEDRYGTGSLIITSQLPIDRWYEIVGNPTLAHPRSDHPQRAPDRTAGRKPAQAARRRMKCRPRAGRTPLQSVT
jgi:hypothetical protein